MSTHEDHFSQKTHLFIIYFYDVFTPAYLYLSQTYNSKLPLVSVLHISAIGVWGRFLKNNLKIEMKSRNIMLVARSIFTK